MTFFVGEQPAGDEVAVSAAAPTPSTMSDQGAAEASTPPLLVLPGDKDPPALLVVRPPAAAAASRKEESAILKLKGLPYTTTEQQILEFFNGFNVSSVAFVYEPDGRPSGLVGGVARLAHLAPRDDP